MSEQRDQTEAGSGRWWARGGREAAGFQHFGGCFAIGHPRRRFDRIAHLGLRVLVTALPDHLERLGARQDVVRVVDGHVEPVLVRLPSRHAPQHAEHHRGEPRPRLSSPSAPDAGRDAAGVAFGTVLARAMRAIAYRGVGDVVLDVRRGRRLRTVPPARKGAATTPIRTKKERGAPGTKRRETKHTRPRSVVGEIRANDGKINPQTGHFTRALCNRTFCEHPRTPGSPRQNLKIFCPRRSASC